MDSNKAYRIILIIICGTIGSVLMGLIFFGTSIFIPGSATFQFLAAGLYASFFFSLSEIKSVREEVFAIVFILIFQIVVFTGRNISFAYIVRDVLYLAGLFLSIKFYHIFLKRNHQLKLYLRAFALAFFFGLINLAFLSAVYFINAEFAFPPIGFIYAVARDAVLIGLGIGLGIDFFISRIKINYLLFSRSKLCKTLFSGLFLIKY